MTDETLGVINETHAIAVNQDALGIQGRRTSVHMPKNTSIVPSDTGRDAVAVIAPCDASSPSQRWTYINASQPAARTLLYLAACDATDVYQQVRSGCGAPAIATLPRCAHLNPPLLPRPHAAYPVAAVELLAGRCPS